MSVLDILRDLRGITSSEQGCTRIAYTHLEDAAHDYAWQVMSSIPDLVRIEDAAGNMFMVPRHAVDSGAPVVLVGSHLDTVIRGGWLDGTLGVVVALDVVRRLATGGRAHPGVGIVVFRDEEGVRFNTGLFGSRVFAGLCSAGDLEVSDPEGVRVRDVVRSAEACLSYAPPVRAAAFLECHIEQGVRLTERENRVGVVPAIVGIRRFELRGIGEANHAGTTEMRRRVDALVSVAEVIGKLPTLVDDLDPAVITCGRLRVEPGAPNIVPGVTSAIIELRASEAATLDLIEQRLRGLVSEARPVLDGGKIPELQLEQVVSVDPVPTDGGLLGLLDEVLTDRGIPFERMVSMAGHDTQHAAHRCPSCMFFIPSIDGISHSPAENSTDDDIRLAADVMHAWVERCLAHFL